MKYALLLPLFLLVSCSSAPKKEAVPAPVKPVTPALTVVAPPKVSRESAPGVHCKQGADERVLTVIPKASGCELSYTKETKTSVIASSATSSKHCDESLSKVRKKLEAGGFTCK